MILVRLFFEFFKVGLFSVGGGLATIPFLTDISNRTGWFSGTDIADMIAISESTPGPIGVNMATYAGFKTAATHGLPGIIGGIVATLGLVAPAIITIYIIARILNKFMGNKYVDGAFYGLRAASIGLVAAAGFGVWKISIITIDSFLQSRNFSDLFVVKGVILAAAILICQRFFKKISPIAYIAISAVVGIVFSFAG